ncbi:hypothetical protein FA13DRAFT_1814144 [Coprinellus micaceus]|uniref:Uncharacterized protein n=1 Tax=Coprinellus micaceus TaxID=71717 RepID=A0A4Y7TA41_COPMI|nr:hypothetical protein FA13DRAFT_1814144 [Coprinellus micaceus]
MFASTLARRALCIARSASAPPRLPLQARHLHATVPVFKKKQTSADLDSLFDDFEIVDESLPPAPKASEKAGTSTPIAGTSGRTRTKLSPEQRAQEFTKVLEFVKPRVGRKPQEKHLEVRNSAWLGMLQLAASEADLRQVVSLMPGWVPSGRKFKDAISEAFVRRCEELKCGILALEVYSDFAKYNFPLTLPAARRLLHSVHRTSIQNVMAASALFAVYKLPAAAQDYVSCAFVVEACLRHNSEDSVAIAQALLPHLRQLEKIDED